MDLALRRPLDLPRAARAAAAGTPCAVSFVADRESFEALAADWRRLEEQVSGAMLFQSFDWCRTVWDHWEREGTDFAPRIVVARRDGRLAGILPLRIVRSGRLRLATGFGEPFQQYTDVLLAPGAGPDLAARMLALAVRQLKVDGLQFLKVRADSTLLPALAALSPIVSNEDGAPYVDLAAHAGFDAYFATLNAKTRKNMRNARNRLGRTGTLAHDVVEDDAGKADLVRRAYAGRQRWLAEQGLTSRAFREPSFAAFVERAATRSGGLDVLAMTLALDGRPLADQWGFVHRGRYYAYAATWDPEFEESSPGKLHLGEVIHACADRGIAVADFLIPAARYKLTWAENVVPVADYAVPLTPKGRLYFSIWSAKVRPFLKRMALMTPPRLRSRIAGLLLPRR